MTISVKAYELEDESLDRPFLLGFWNNDGGLLIESLTREDRAKLDAGIFVPWGSYSSVRLMPFELDRIVKMVGAEVGDVLFHADRIAPGLFIRSLIVGAILRDDDRIEVYLDLGDERRAITAPRKVWQDLLLACCQKRDGYMKECGIIPMMGANLPIEQDVKVEELAVGENNV